MRRHFDNEFKTTVVELLQAGKSVGELCEEYDLQDGTVRRWRREYDQKNGDLTKKRERTASEVELSQLRKELRETIYLGDETGCRSDYQAGKSYAPKGKTPIIKATGKRYTVNMISAIGNRGHLQFMLMDKGFNSEVFKTFLQQMIKLGKGKVFFITDNRPAHKTIEPNEWLENNRERIEVFFIPPCSPELNPQDLKTNIIGKKRAINKDRPKENIGDFMNKRKKDRPQVKKYFHHRHARYAT